MGRKWANIVAKKTAKDGANSKVYAKFGVEIYVAAKKGEPHPEPCETSASAKTRD